jgi:hypothetical protein
MRIMASRLFPCLVVALALARNPCLPAQDSPTVVASSETPPLIVGHPFTAIKYARRVKVLPDGKLQFIRNQRYPTRIARDADGRLMMQVIHSDQLQSECDRLDLPAPPVCPSWDVFVIDPVAHTVTHWPAGEFGAHRAVDFPLSLQRLQETSDVTASLPALGPDFTEEDGKMRTFDLGDREIEGVQAHGVRWTLDYDANDQAGRTVHRTRIHEVWTSAEMQLIVRVIDGDPNGGETMWGLEKISLAPDDALFRPPDDYEMQHRMSAQWAGRVDQFVHQDFEFLHEWFAE